MQRVWRPALGKPIQPPQPETPDPGPNSSCDGLTTGSGAVYVGSESPKERETSHTGASGRADGTCPGYNASDGLSRELPPEKQHSAAHLTRTKRTSAACGCRPIHNPGWRETDATSQVRQHTRDRGGQDNGRQVDNTLFNEHHRRPTDCTPKSQHNGWARGGCHPREATHCKGGERPSAGIRQAQFDAHNWINNGFSVRSWEPKCPGQCPHYVPHYVPAFLDAFLITPLRSSMRPSSGYCVHRP